MSDCSEINFSEIKISSKISFVSENSAYSESYSALVQGKIEIWRDFELQVQNVMQNCL